MAQVTRLGLYGGPRPPQTFAAAADNATIAGTAVTGSPTEADIVAGGFTIIITLNGREFKAAGTGPIGSEADSLVLLSGMNSAQAEATGWNAEVRDKEVTTAITRDSATQATILLSAAPAYDITANETITVIVPADVLTEGLALVATPTFDVTFVEAAEDAATAGGGGDRWHKRKRKLVLGGRVYEVETLREEQQLLEKYIEERKDALPEMVPAKKKATRISIRKAEKRAEVVEDRMAALLADDEEVLLLFSASGGD